MSTAPVTAAEIEAAGGSLPILLELAERLHRWQRPAYLKARKAHKGIAEALAIAIVPIDYTDDAVKHLPLDVRHALFNGKA
jgi:hypothetical protein